MLRARSGGWAVLAAVLMMVLAGTATANASTAATDGPAAIAVKYAATGGSTGPLGAATDSATCNSNDVCVQHFTSGEITWYWTTGAVALDDLAIYTAWMGSGADGGILGLPTYDATCGLYGGGCSQRFQHGAIARSTDTPAIVMPEPSDRAWMTWESGSGYLGYPTAAYECPSPGDGCLQRFQGGFTGWTPNSQPPGSAVIAPFAAVWSSAGLGLGQLGYPLSDRICDVPLTGCVQDFERGSIYSSPAGTFFVRQELLDGYGRQGAQSGPLGYPVGNSFCGLTNGGCGSHFQGGSVYWNFSAGSQVVLPQVAAVWARTGWERGPLQYPTGSIFTGLRNGGWGQHFENGSIYGSPAGAFAVTGAVYTRWAALGWERGVLGYPTTSTYCGLRRGYCGEHFQNGVIYWAPQGTFKVYDGIWHGVIQRAWAATGWERGPLGYPVSDTFCGLRDGGCGQHFEGDGLWSSVYVSPASGGRAVIVAPPIRSRWAELGWERGRLGYPTGPQYLIPGGWAQPFQGGVLKVVKGIWNM
jgi:uncharacterized protein with LGFP repeats